MFTCNLGSCYPAMLFERRLDSMLMKQTIEAIFEGGSFRPMDSQALRLSGGQHVKLTIEDDDASLIEMAERVYEGLSDKESRVRQPLTTGDFTGPRLAKPRQEGIARRQRIASGARSGPQAKA